jgi:hypothetical protein
VPSAAAKARADVRPARCGDQKTERHSGLNKWISSKISFSETLNYSKHSRFIEKFLAACKLQQSPRHFGALPYSSAALSFFVTTFNPHQSEEL